MGEGGCEKELKQRKRDFIIALWADKSSFVLTNGPAVVSDLRNEQPALESHDLTSPAPLIRWKRGTANVAVIADRTSTFRILNC